MRLVAEGLSAKRGEDLIFQDISFEIAGGEALVVKGANGSGKSTLLRVLAGLLPAHSGTVKLLAAAQPVERVGEAAHYLGHRDALKPSLSVAENLIFWADFLGEPARPPAAALEAVGLAALASLPAGYLSAGQRRRLSLARLVAAERPVWLLDEPTAALDSAGQALVSDLMGSHLARGGLIVAATHVPLGVERQELRLGMHRVDA